MLVLEIVLIVLVLVLVLVCSPAFGLPMVLFIDNYDSFVHNLAR